MYLLQPSTLLPCSRPALEGELACSQRSCPPSGACMCVWMRVQACAHALAHTFLVFWLGTRSKCSCKLEQILQRHLKRHCHAIAKEDLCSKLFTVTSAARHCAQISCVDPAIPCRYVELHMEQGPVLQDRGVALGPVLGIAGQSRLMVHIKGTQVRLNDGTIDHVAHAYIVPAYTPYCPMSRPESGLQELLAQWSNKMYPANLPG